MSSSVFPTLFDLNGPDIYRTDLSRSSTHGEWAPGCDRVRHFKVAARDERGDWRIELVRYTCTFRWWKVAQSNMLDVELQESTEWLESKSIRITAMSSNLF